MDYKRIALAAVAAWIVDTLYGVVVWMNLMSGEMARYPEIFRPPAQMNAAMPVGIAGGLLAMFALAYIYAKGYEGGSGMAEGLRFGILLAIFNFGFFTLGIYASFNFGRLITLYAAVVGAIEMIIVGLVLGAIYRPSVSARAARAAAV